MTQFPWFRCTAFLVSLMMTTSLSAETLVLRAGTTVYGELDQRVVSKKKEFSEGDFVRARVWRNVVVDGQTVIRAGTPMIIRVAKLKKNRMFGVKGKLELEAVSTTNNDGSQVLLDGGYDKSGKGRKGWAIASFLLVAWPLMFIQGKNAVLETGTVFDSTVQADIEIESSNSGPPKISLGGGPKLSAAILYDEGEDDWLPIELRVCEGSLTDASIVTINGEGIDAIALELGERADDEDCETIQARIRLKDLGKHFVPGINRFGIDMMGTVVELILDVEL